METSLKFQGSTERAPARSMGGFLDDVTALSVRFGIQPSVPLPAAIAQMNMLMGIAGEGDLPIDETV